LFENLCQNAGMFSTLYPAIYVKINPNLSASSSWSRPHGRVKKKSDPISATLTAALAKSPAPCIPIISNAKLPIHDACATVFLVLFTLA